jgi:hypothetical protein
VCANVATGHKPSTRRSTATPQQTEKSTTQTITQTSEYVPSQTLPTVPTVKAPALPTFKKFSTKRKSSFDVVIPTKSKSTSKASSVEPKNDKSRHVTPAAENPSVPIADESPDQPLVKRRRFVFKNKVIEDSQPQVVTSSAPLLNDLIDLSSARSSSVKPKPSEPAAEKPASLHTPAPKSATPKSRTREPSERESRSKRLTPPRLAASRHRSVSPVTKVDSWLSIDSEGDFETAFAGHDPIPPPPDTFHSGSISQIRDLPDNSLDDAMNPAGPPMGASGSNFTPIQTIHRQMGQFQSGQNRTGSPSPPVSAGPRPGQGLLARGGMAH